MSGEHDNRQRAEDDVDVPGLVAVRPVEHGPDGPYVRGPSSSPPRRRRPEPLARFQDSVAGWGCVLAVPDLNRKGRAAPRSGERTSLLGAALV